MPVPFEPFLLVWCNYFSCSFWLTIGSSPTGFTISIVRPYMEFNQMWCCVWSFSAFELYDTFSYALLCFLHRDRGQLSLTPPHSFLHHVPHNSHVWLSHIEMYVYVCIRACTYVCVFVYVSEGERERERERRRRREKAATRVCHAEGKRLTMSIGSHKSTEIPRKGLSIWVKMTVFLLHRHQPYLCSSFVCLLAGCPTSGAEHQNPFEFRGQ